MSDDSERGLYQKYIVRHADGRELDGQCFVLRPDRDVFARFALEEYARCIWNKTLAADIYAWLDRILEGAIEPDPPTQEN